MFNENEWWDRWWRNDWSWEGLAKIYWPGFLVLPTQEIVFHENAITEGQWEWVRHTPKGTRKATLQDYWRTEEKHLIVEAKSEKKFTRFHLPLYAKGEEGIERFATEKLHWQSNHLDDAIQNRVDWLLKLSRGSRDKALPLEFSGIILYNFDLSGTLKNLTQESIPILGKFSASMVRGNLNIDEAEFAPGSTFENSLIKNKANFYRTKWPDRTFFRNSIFGENTCFFESQFKGSADFRACRFMGSTDFQDSIFEGSITFANSVFGRHAHYSDFTRFGGARFLTSASFDDALFMDRVDFGGICSGRTLRGNGEVMREKPSSQREAASFDYFSFRRAIFIGPVDFSDRIFSRSMPNEQGAFDRVEFYDLVKCSNINMHRGVSFVGANFEASLGNDIALFRVGGKKVGNDVSNTRSRFDEKLDQIAEHWIGKKPNRNDFGEDGEKRYQECAKEWQEKFRKFRREFLSRRTKRAKFEHENANYEVEYFRALEDCFCTLRQLHEERRDRVEEVKFHRLEMLARRRRGADIPSWDRLLSFVYEIIADFGTSLVRPLLVLVLVVFVFAVTYSFLLALPFSWPNISDRIEAAGFSASRVLPFGPWSGQDPCSALGQALNVSGAEAEICEEQHFFKSGTSLLIGVLGSVESVVAAMLFFLMGLVIRRRYQID